MNIWHDIDKNRIKPEDFYAVVEISKGSKNKYELDKSTGLIMLDRILYTSTHYPANYGFVPNTLSDDGDPADVLVINEYPLQAGSVIKARLIGVLVMEDESGMDEKLIAVPVSKIDPRYDRIQSLEDLPQITLDRIKNFFETYKMLEPNKWVKVKEYKDLKAAKEILDKAIKNYK